MADKDRQQRRAKKLARQKKCRAQVARPARDSPGAGSAAPSFKEGLDWPPGDCFLTTGWDEPGAVAHAVFVRSHDDGRSVAAFVTIDRSGPGVREARLATLPSEGAVLAECGRISETEGELGFHGAPPSLVAGLLRDAAEHGEAPLPEAWSRVRALMAGVSADALDVPFGQGPPSAERAPSMLERLFRFLG